MLGEARRAGLVAMSLEHLFHLISQNSDRYYLLKLSMLEIYNEVINDLLEPGSTNLVLREDAAKRQVMVAGVKSVEVRVEAAPKVICDRNVAAARYLPACCFCGVATCALTFSCTTVQTCR
jgi:hypothetical protein